MFHLNTLAILVEKVLDVRPAQEVMGENNLEDRVRCFVDILHYFHFRTVKKARWNDGRVDPIKKKEEGNDRWFSFDSYSFSDSIINCIN